MLVEAALSLLEKGENIEVSSAYKNVFEVIVSGMLFMYSRKKRGPRILPCGTPALTKPG